ESRATCSEFWVPAFAGTNGYWNGPLKIGAHMSLTARGFRRAFLEKGLEPRFCLLVALGDRRGQRLHEIAGGGVGAGDARQDVRDGEIGHGRVARDVLRQLEAFGESRAGGDAIGGD